MPRTYVKKCWDGRKKEHRPKYEIIKGKFIIHFD